MIPYIGDISKADALVLSMVKSLSGNILEFGCGASTQVMAAYADKDTEIVSIDTDAGWIEKTKENLSLLGIEKKVEFQDYREYMGTLLKSSPTFDFVFDDGVDHLRREFAIRIWPYISIEGALAMHDTRRAPDFRNVLEILATFQDQIDTVYFNYLGSNITIIKKKEAQPYDNWQITEKKEPWQLGYGPIPEEFKLKMKDHVCEGLKVFKKRMNDEVLDRLYDVIAHGDEGHRKWLKDKIEEFKQNNSL